MPRFVIAVCDTSTGEIRGHITSKFTADQETEAILSHPWFTEIYTDRWIAANLHHPDADNCRQNIWSQLSWSVMCVNLDLLIMNDLNGGDSSVSSEIQH